MTQTATLLDLRGLTVEDVTRLTTEHGIVEPRSGSSDITHLYHDTEYASVVCVWLGPNHQEGFEFIIWNGKQVPWRHGCDLHGFVKPDGKVDWGSGAHNEHDALTLHKTPRPASPGFSFI